VCPKELVQAGLAAIESVSLVTPVKKLDSCGIHC
jgi:hypothetical protein